MAKSSSNTPVPTDIIIDLTSSVSRLEGTLTEGFTGMKERLTSLEEKPPHACLYPAEVEQARSIPEHKAKIDGLEKWRWWLMGLIASVAIAVVSFVVITRSTEATTTERLDSVQSDVVDIEGDVDELDKNLQETREQIIREIKSQGQATREKVSNGHGEGTIKIVPSNLEKLRPYERIQFEKMLKRVSTL